jgi:hypothetical protein
MDPHERGVGHSSEEVSVMEMERSVESLKLRSFFLE